MIASPLSLAMAMCGFIKCCLSRTVVDGLYATRGMFASGTAVEKDDLSESRAAIDRLAEVPTDDGFVLHKLALLRLRALLARAHRDETGYRDYAKGYRYMANSLGFEGHMAPGAAMA